MTVAWLFMPVCSLADPPGFMKYRMGTMEGQVFFDNKPVADALLAFFDQTKGLPPISGLSGRIPESLGRTDTEGRFKVKLIQGNYYLGILLRGDDEAVFGPPREGEIFYFADAGAGKLRSFAIKDFQEINVGRIDSSLPTVFTETEDHFTVEGTVYREEGDQPFQGALVMAKTTPTMRRPEYFSERTGQDGKYSINLPPGRTFYLVAREIITGSRPTTGEGVGKYGAASESSATNISVETQQEQQVAGPPPGVEKKNTPRIIADSIPVTGSSGQLISGLNIVMYKMPDQQELRSENMRLAEAPDYETGFAISNLYFAYNSYKLDKLAFAELDLWVNFFQGRRDVTITLIGHTDNRGSDAYNLKLSHNRAVAVADYLMSKGISAERISVESAGSANPIADNGTEEGRGKNRRVDIKFEK